MDKQQQEQQGGPAKAGPQPAPLYHVYNDITLRYQPVEDARRVTIEGFEDEDLFVHPALGASDLYNVTDAVTGTAISYLAQTPEQAVEWASGVLREKGRCALRRARKIRVEHQGGPSPLYVGRWPADEEAADVNG